MANTESEQRQRAEKYVDEQLAIMRKYGDPGVTAEQRERAISAVMRAAVKHGRRRSKKSS